MANRYPLGNLSAWDTVSMDENGAPSNGYSDVTPLGYHAETILDNIYVSHDQSGLWQKNHPWGKNVIAVVREGIVVIGDLHIAIRRSRREGIMFVTWFQEAARLRAMLGVTVASQDDDCKWVGVLPEDIEPIKQFVAELSDAKFVHTYLNSIDWSKSLRFNQGDRYSVGQTGVPVVTIPGCAGPPMVTHLAGSPQTNGPKL